MCRKQKMLRCVVREDLSFEMATDLVNDMKQVIEWLDHHFIYSGQTLSFEAVLTAYDKMNLCCLMLLLSCCCSC